jgi:radical SAM superfamily enzyme YgiQ (UPF0313 family)
MPHVAFVPFTGFRIREQEMLALGMSLPSLHQRAAAIGQLPALGLLTLAGMTPSHWTCSYHETPRWDESFAEKILAQRPNLVAISALTASIEEAYRFSAFLRSRNTLVVVGGLHATACPDEASQFVDAVVVGEGESVWKKLLDDVESKKLNPVYRSAGPFDLSHSPTPRFDLLGTSPRPRFTLQTQRGCPFACDFCGASRLLGIFREKPLANLQRELAAIQKVAPRPVVELADDNSFAGERPVEPLFAALAEAGIRYFTEADWRVGERPDVLHGLAASGCVQLLVGIESLVFRHTGMGAKAADLTRVIDALQAIQDAGVAVLGCFILGCDGENRASLDRLARFLLDCPLADLQLTIQTPFPGTSLYGRLRREGRLLVDRSWRHYTLFDVTYQPDQLSVAELEREFRSLVRQVFAPAVAARRQAIRRDVWQRNPRLRSCASEPSFST